jgi:hypothetical protein
LDAEGARAIRDECVATGVKFFFWQWNGRNSKATGRKSVGVTWEEKPGGEDELIAFCPRCPLTVGSRIFPTNSWNSREESVGNAENHLHTGAGDRRVALFCSKARPFMISVEFRSVGHGTCSWCRKDKSEVFTVAFGDRSFSGPMCWNDLRCAIRLKAGGAGQAETARSATEAGDDA